MRYWHVQADSYRPGQALYSPREYLRRLRAIEARDAEERSANLSDTNLSETVLLFESLEEAEAQLAEVGGVLLQVDLPDPPVRAEDYHRSWRRIPADWVRLVPLTDARAA